MNQAEAMAYFMPLIEDKGVDYKKFSRVEVRPAIEGERIDTHTADGKETTNVAGKDDVVVCNVDTTAKEEYLLSSDKLKKRYHEIEGKARDGWKLYQASGEFRGYVYEGEEMKFEASWGEDMVLKKGDMIGTALPQKNEVYRIARAEFEKTYRRKD